MPVVFRRSLIFRQEDNESIENDLYQSLSQEWRDSLVTYLRLEEQPDMLAQWPTVNWSNGFGSITAIGQELKDESPLPIALRIQITQRHSDHRWLAHLILSQLQDDEVKLFEQWIIEWNDVSAFKRLAPFDEIPSLLSFASHYGCRDEDGMIANKPYSVSIDRISAFYDFLKSSERHLPVVVISRVRNNSRYLLPESSTMARKMRGMAHVIRLADNQTAQRFRRLLPNDRYACYHGAVRVYWPGFKSTHDPDRHRVWLPSELQDPKNIQCIQNDIFAFIAERSHVFLSENDDFEELERSVREREKRKRQKLYEKRVKEQIELRLQAQADAELEELSRLCDDVDNERNLLLEQNKQLKDELAQRDQEVRRLRWQLNAAWQSKRPVEPETEHVTGPQLFLSSKASKQFHSFDLGEQGYWDEHILAKLLDEQLRDRQSEPRGHFRIYPRSKSAGARRVAYYVQDDDVYVCELLKHDQEYDKLSTSMGDRKIDRESYNGFEPHQFGG